MTDDLPPGAAPPALTSHKEDRIRVEQLRMLYANMAPSVLPMLPASLLLVLALDNGHNRYWLALWWLALTLINAVLVLDARRCLAQTITPPQVSGQVRRLMGLTAIEGGVWGLLAWVPLDAIVSAQMVLVVAVITGIIGGAVSLLAPMLRVYAAFAVGIMSPLVLRLWLLGDPALFTLGLTGVLYLASMMVNARNSGWAVRGSIMLRFENLDLMAQTEAARRDAEQANLAKSKFLAAASHDLRQPIHAQGLFLEVLARTDLSAYQREVLASARSASLASSDMLNTLLDFSRIEAGVVMPLTQPFQLQDLFSKIENDLAPLADAKGLIYRTRETAWMVDSDAALVELILRNLVSNAIRYTHKGGVLVACRRRGAAVVVEVWDTGIGIAPAHQKEVFREFHQLANPERDRRKGLGLGLAIADGLARALGHGLMLRSTVHRGSVFCLELPLATEAAPAVSLTTKSATLQLLQRRVLVIEDDPAVRDGMVQLLRSWGCECEAAEGLDEALTLARNKAPEVVVCDYRLRERLTGLDVIAALRALLGSELPALLITGDTDPVRLREAMAGQVPLLHKPVTPAQLHQALVEAKVVRPAFGSLQARA
jgi:signal transduction histidine kinase/ActR/RegA family two-component response regulator